MLDRVSLEDRAIAWAERDRRRARKLQGESGYYEGGVRQGGLIAFVRYFWDILEPATPFVDGWPLWAMCEHLEAVTRGEITRLLINVPPGFMKSLLVDVFWPAWEWGPMGLEHYRYVSFSYSADLTHRDNGKFRDLVDSQRYKDLYGGTVQIRNKTTEKVINTRAGYKLSSSVGGVGTGERGDRIIIDDPHKVDQAESDLIRSTAVKWFREEISDRFNSLKHGAMVIIMQRVHEEDVSGLILENPEFGFEHLMIPMRFEYGRNIDAGGEYVPTATGWLDPRAGDGELAWPARFDSEGCQKLEFLKGPYAWAGQYQQSPAPRGGGIFQREWWQVWEPKTWPNFDYVVASVDGAFTEKEENCPSAMTVWGIFELPKDGEAPTLYTDPQTGAVVSSVGNGIGLRRRLMLIQAWRKHLKFSCATVERLKVGTVINNEKFLPDYIEPSMGAMEKKVREERYLYRAQKEWGLLEWIRYTANRTKAHLVLIEGKGPGLSAAEQLRQRYGTEGWVVQVEGVKGDKVARALAAQATFSQGGVYAPVTDYAQLVIDEMATFPKGKTDDLTDSATQAINYLRRMGLAPSDEEVEFEEAKDRTYKKKLGAIYPV